MIASLQHRSVKELYGTLKGHLCFVVGLGNSIANAEKHLKEKHPHVFTIALNKAIERVPADFWFWMDLPAYEASKDHPNAKKAIRCGVDLYAQHYDPETYVWERAGNPDKIGAEGHRDFFADVFQKGKLAWNSASAVGSACLAWNLGAFRIAFVGCENTLDEEYIKRREAEDPSKNWRSIYIFTFARVAEAFKNRFAWMHPKVMMVDASHTGSEWGILPLAKTTIPQELSLLKGFYEHLKKDGKLEATT